MKYILLLLPFLSLQCTTMAQDKMTLIYVGDPMCSWCYGFSPELTKAVENMDSNIELELVMGGLRPHNQQTISELGDFLQEHWEEVNKRSGQPFSYDILKSTTIRYDTEPACRAVVAMRKVAPEKEFAYFKAVQTGFYFENKNPNEAATYIDLAAKMSVDKTAFEKAFNDIKTHEATQADFERAGALGVRGFPAMLLKKGDQYYPIANGYTTSEAVLAAINQIR